MSETIQARLRESAAQYRFQDIGSPRLELDAAALIDTLTEALTYARRFLKPADVDLTFIDAALARARGEQS